MLTAAASLLLLLCSAPGIPDDNAARAAHVRPLTEFARTLVAEASKRSSTFEGLLSSLESTHVVVYVDVAPFLRTRGSLSFVSYAAETTYVMAQIKSYQSFEESVTTLSHELQHALEVASSPKPVTSDQDLERLYRQIGFPAEYGARESDAALRIETAVRRDLTRSHSTDLSDPVAPDVADLAPSAVCALPGDTYSR